MGGKSSPNNSQMVAFQMQQAAEARRKEEERKARLEQGKGAIDKLFSPEYGFNENFYNKYKNAALAYGLPQLSEQYEKARENTTYDLARAGLLRSTAAGEAVANIERQNAVNEASLRAKADIDTANLRSSVGSQQQQALNQLYATEDPEVAATTAINMVNNAQLAQPNLTPLGDLFKPLVIGATGAYNTYTGNQQFQNALQTNRPTQGSYNVTQG
jgi:hypothetical protein